MERDKRPRVIEQRDAVKLLISVFRFNVTPYHTALLTGTKVVVSKVR